MTSKKPAAAMFRVGYGGEKVRIAPQWRVLDVGSGSNPFERANVYLERSLEKSTHRSGKLAIIKQNLVRGDATKLPFRESSFDYVIVSHVAEHVDDIDNLMKELQRVAKSGYIETPGIVSELLLNEATHIWYVTKKKDVLQFRRKKRFVPISQLFYALYYLNESRYRRTTIKTRNIFLRLTRFVLNRIWKYIPYSFVKYHWNGSIKYQVTDETN